MKFQKQLILLAALVFPLACGPTKKIETPAATRVEVKNPPFSLDELQRRHFQYFWALADKTNFQIPDRYPAEAFSSIAATGFGLSAYLVGVERGWVTRAQAAERVFKTLEVLKNLPQGPEPSGVAGYRGWFYHFLNEKALRFEKVELSSIDTGLLMAGVLSCMTYFDGPGETEREIREMADFLFRRVEFDWFLNEHRRLSMGWFPERGFLGSDWRGYNEAMILPIMALGSPTHPIPAATWEKWCQYYFRADWMGQDMVNFGPLFGHQYSHCWIDFRGIRDPYMEKMGIDYFENSRRATLSQQKYAIENPGGFVGYGSKIWGLTAGDGPDAEFEWKGKKIWAAGYGARGAAFDYSEDDGTIAPTAALASMPFAPEIVLPTAEEMWRRWPVGEYGFFDGYNESFTEVGRSPKAQAGYPFWVDKDYLGIDQGPIVLMIENHRSSFLWDLMKKNPYVVRGLQRAGFKGGWLENVDFQKISSGIKWAEGELVKPNPDVPAEPASFFKREIFKSNDGGRLPYWLMEPWNGKSNKKYPLVVFLHGAGERGFDNEKQMRNGVFAFAETVNRKEHACFLLVPQCPEGEVWGGVTRDWQKVTFSPDTYSRPGRQVIEMVIKMLKTNPMIDPARVYITGLSMGGFGTFDLLMREPNLFAAGIPLCGGGDPEHAERIKNVPLWVFHGRMDEAVPPKYSWQIVEALKKAGSKVRYTEFSTKGHDIWEIVYYDQNVMDWLFSQKK